MNRRFSIATFEHARVAITILTNAVNSCGLVISFGPPTPELPALGTEYALPLEIAPEAAVELDAAVEGGASLLIVPLFAAELLLVPDVVDPPVAGGVFAFVFNGFADDISRSVSQAEFPN